MFAALPWWPWEFLSSSLSKIFTPKEKNEKEKKGRENGNGKARK
jgi:hypothetical protein